MITVIVKIGRRVPRNWFKRSMHKFKGFLTFQENMWIIIDRSLTLAKKKATASNTGISFVKQTYRELEDLNYDIEWIEIKINGNPQQEEEEYNEALCMYKGLKDIIKREFTIDKDFKKPFKTGKLSEKQIKEAYKAGYGALGEENISQKLLDLGILTHIEKI